MKTIKETQNELAFDKLHQNGTPLTLQKYLITVSKRKSISDVLYKISVAIFAFEVLESFQTKILYFLLTTTNKVVNQQ